MCAAASFFLLALQALQMTPIIYFNAVGTGILDLAVTTRCYRKAMEEGVGTKLAYWE